MNKTNEFADKLAESLKMSFVRQKNNKLQNCFAIISAAVDSVSKLLNISLVVNAMDGCFLIVCKIGYSWNNAGLFLD